MSPLQQECTNLYGEGIQPQDVVEMSRHLKMPEIISKAFPAMPTHVRDDLYIGTKEFKLVDNCDWHIFAVE